MSLLTLLQSLSTAVIAAEVASKGPVVANQHRRPLVQLCSAPGFARKLLVRVEEDKLLSTPRVASPLGKSMGSYLRIGKWPPADRAWYVLDILRIASLKKDS